MQASHDKPSESGW